MTWIDIELALVGAVAMLEPATLISSVLALVVGRRPLRTGGWFYVGGLGLTLAVGVLAAIVLGSGAASTPSTAEPKEWVAIVNVVAGCAILGFVVVAMLRPANPERTAANLARISALDTAPATTIVLAGAVLANAGLFMVVALKDISQLDPSRVQYILDWTLFAFVSLLPLGLGLVMLRFAPGRAMPVLARARSWIERRARPLAFGVMALLAVSLLRDGIAALLN